MLCKDITLDAPVVIDGTDDTDDTDNTDNTDDTEDIILTLDLNGHTLKRDLTAPVANGCVIRVEQNATLTIVGNGKITGGNSTGNGGGICNHGTLTLEGGEISGNKAKNGGGVYNYQGTFAMTGGKIEGNTASQCGGGVYSRGVIKLSGDVRVQNNTQGDPAEAGNVYLHSGALIQVTGELAAQAAIDVRMQAPGVFTEGFPTHANDMGPDAYFASDDSTVGLGAAPNSGEAMLITYYTLSTTGCPDTGVTWQVKGAAATPDANGNLPPLAAGDEISLSATDEGFALNAVRYTPEGGEAVDVLPDANGAFRFAMPAANADVSATLVDERVMYLDENGEEQPVPAQEITASTDVTTTPLTGWYCVKGNVTVEERIEAGAGFNLILCDGATLNAPEGIHVPADSSLTVYAQSAGTGALTINGVDDFNAGIGGDENESAGAITIVGGVIEVAGGINGAGIGGGSGKEGGTITITGDTVTATGNGGAGIGGGDSGDGGTITITGGTVTATGGSGGAGIGGGNNVPGGNITISGGTVTATGGNNGAGIGGGNECDGGTIVITGGQIKATSGEFTASSGEESKGIGRGRKIDDTDRGSLTMSLQKDTDYIQANSYGTGNFTVKVADGKSLRIAGTNQVYNSGKISDVSAIADKRLVKGDISGYAVCIDPTSHGTVSVEHGLYSAGDTFTLTATPDEGYVLGTLTVTYGNAQTLAPNQDGSYTMPAANVTVSATFTTPWQWLQEKINTSDSVITLQQDIVAQSDDAALTLSANKTVTIDLNGHKIDRALTSAQDGGNVITVGSGSTLIITGTGTITGGDNKNGAGGIIVNHTLKLNGGSITGNVGLKGGVDASNGSLVIPVTPL